MGKVQPLKPSILQSTARPDGALSTVIHLLTIQTCSALCQITIRRNMKVGDVVRVKLGTYQELVKRNYHTGVPERIDGALGEIVTDYTEQPDPHYGVQFPGMKEEIGIPVDYLCHT